MNIDKKVLKNVTYEIAIIVAAIYLAESLKSISKLWNSLALLIIALVIIILIILIKSNNK